MAFSGNWAALCHLLDLPGAPKPGLDVLQRSYHYSIWIQLASLRAVGLGPSCQLQSGWCVERILTYRPELETKLSRHTTAMDFRRDKSGSLLIQLQGALIITPNQQIALRKASNNWVL